MPSGREEDCWCRNIDANGSSALLLTAPATGGFGWTFESGDTNDGIDANGSEFALSGIGVVSGTNGRDGGDEPALASMVGGDTTAGEFGCGVNKSVLRRITCLIFSDSRCAFASSSPSLWSNSRTRVWALEREHIMGRAS